jgi:small-conductance mechanosensitive channel
MNLHIGELASHPLFMNAVAFMLSALLILLLVRLAQYIATGSIEDKELRYKTRKALALTGYVVGLVVAVAIFSDQLTNLAVIIGALSVGIGFALRELIQNLIGWSVISFGGLYKSGDRIQMGGVMGDVMDVGPLTTTVMECGAWVKSDLYNGRVAHLPNNLVLREQVINYTPDFPFLWDEIVIPVRTGSDHRLARNIIETVGKTEQARIVSAARDSWTSFVRYNRADEAGLDAVVTMSFDQNWIEFTLRYVTDYSARRSTKDRLFTAVLDKFEQTGGKVEIARPLMQLTDIPPISLNADRR